MLQLVANPANRLTYGAGNSFTFHFDIFLNTSLNVSTKAQVDALLTCSAPFGKQNAWIQGIASVWTCLD